jgi:hypothetical protein
MTPRRLCALLAVAALGAAAPGLASGQGRAGASDSKPAATRKAAPDRQKPKKVLKLEDLEVEGRADRPVVKSLAPPRAVSGGRERPESFLHRVVEAVEREPF